ncbi:MAG: hemerythrin family protein [Anaerolineales bacterium]
MYTPRKLAWDNALTTGDTELDAQHKYFINIFNELGDTITNELGADEIERMLGMMKFYAGWHFGREEDCMEKYHCPVAEKNKSAHVVFIEKINKYRAEFEHTQNYTALALQIHEDLSDWIVKHILAVDGQLYPCIHKRPKP